MQRARRRRDDGFTLIELIVAMVIIGMVLVSIVAVQTAALVTTAQTKQRTQATAIANETMEELRALPWLVLAKGLRTTFATAAGGDPNVTGGRFKPVANTAIDEALVTDSSQATDKLPLSGAGGTNKIVSTDPSIPGSTFTTRTYVTRTSASAQALTLTVVTSWVQNQSGKARSVMVRSQAYAPDGGCGDRANQPFLGACQALISASAGVAGPAITLSPASVDPTLPLAPGTPLLPGVGYASALVKSSGASASTSSQQATTIESTATPPGVTLLPLDPAAEAVVTAGLGLVTHASNDVGAQGAAPPDPAAVTGLLSGGTQSFGTGASTLNLASGSGATGTVRASLATSCQSGVPAGQGCGSGSVAGGTGGRAALTVGAQSFVMADLSGVNTSPFVAFSARFATAPGNSSVGCVSLSGPGCGSGGASRGLTGMSRFGVGPWASGAATDGLVTIADYSDSILTERGETQRTATATSTRTGTIRIWNGTGYTQVVLGPASNGVHTTPVVTWTADGKSVTASATVTVTAAASLADNPDAAACRSAACTIAADSGTVTVSVTFVVNDGTSPYGIAASADYGSSRASASFKAAPID